MNKFHGSGFEKVDSLRSAPRRARSALLGMVAAHGLLAAIPPERVGLDGEYDHSGLAKRVQQTLRQALGDEFVAQLEIAQRGKVVIVRGNGLESWLVRQVTRLTLEVEGADFVEVDDRRVDDRQTAACAQVA
jgi:hypothetical protein